MLIKYVRSEYVNALVCSFPLITVLDIINHLTLIWRIHSLNEKTTDEVGC
jgi:hypothetical protein